MANLESHLNGLRSIYELVKYIANDTNSIKNADWRNDFSAFQLDSWFPAENHSNVPPEIKFYNFSRDMEIDFRNFVDRFAAYNEATKTVYIKNGYWLYIEKLPEWQNLKKSACKLEDRLINYFESLGIHYNTP